MLVVLNFPFLLSASLSLCLSVSFSLSPSPLCCSFSPSFTLHLDPVPIFEQALAVQQKLMSAQDLDIENKQLRDTLNEYNKEFAQVRNQGK